MPAPIFKGSSPSPIITRGFGSSQRIVTQGYGPQVFTLIKTFLNKGSSAIKRLPDVLFVVKACLIEVNDIEVLADICGIDRRSVDMNQADPAIRATLVTERENIFNTKEPEEISISVEPHVRVRKKDG